MNGTVDTPYTSEFLAFSRLEAIYDEMAFELNKLSYDSKYFPHLVAVALLNNCLETALAMVFLSKAPTDGGHPILLRTLFESTARLMFLTRSQEDNALILENIDCTEMLKRIGRNEKEEEPEETTAIRKILTERLEAPDTIKAKGLNFKDILTEINSASLYPIYQALSGITHGQITPLFLQGFAEQPDGSKFKILRRLPEEKRQAFQEMAIALLQLAQLSIGKILGHTTPYPVVSRNPGR